MDTVKNLFFFLQMHQTHLSPGTTKDLIVILRLQLNWGKA